MAKTKKPAAARLAAAGPVAAGPAAAVPVAAAVPAAAVPVAKPVAEGANGEAAVMFAGYEQWSDVGRENFSAVLRANAALTEGLEAMGKEVIQYARRSFEQVAETATALLGAKTFEDVVQLNTQFAKANLEGLIERSARLSEMGVMVASEALAPLGGRVEAAIHKLSKPIGA
jgi:phasin family protein